MNPLRTSWRNLLAQENLRRLRLWSGLVMFAYVLMHFIVHALGLISAETQQAGGSFNTWFWRGIAPLSWLLYASLAVHAALALHLVVVRRRLVPSATVTASAAAGSAWRETLQLVLGLTLPFLLALHVMGTRWAHEIYDLRDSYEYIILSTFVFSPIHAWINAAALVAVWIHAVIGLHMWLRFRPWYAEHPTLRATALGGAVALPILSLAGYLSAAREIAPLAGDGDWLGGYYERLRVVDDAVFVAIGDSAVAVRWIALGLIVAALVARLGLKLWRRRQGTVEICYLDGPTVRAAPGPTLLEISQGAGVPHASVCGGHGRCSTCRVKVLDAEPEPGLAASGERRLLSRVRATDDVRLACQWRPSGRARVMRLLPADTAATDLNHSDTAGLTGEEREITVMFADLRGFTMQSEDRLPFDVVYLINQFARAAGEAIEWQGGRVDKLLGDGVMALFETTTRSGGNHASGALRATLALAKGIETMNERLASDLKAPLRIAVGLHTGPAIVGEMGHGGARSVTALGDAVNVASRLESVAKAHDALLAVSAVTLERAGLTPDRRMLQPVEIRGRHAGIEVARIADRAALTRLLGGESTDDAALTTSEASRLHGHPVT